MGKSPRTVNREIEEIRKPLEYIIPDSVSNRFSNFTVVQHESEAFTLSFFEIQRPLLTGADEERKKAAEELSSVPAVCVARIVVTPTHFKNLVNAMQVNLEKYEKGPSGQKTESD